MPKAGLAGVLTAAVPYLHLAVTVTGGWLHRQIGRWPLPATWPRARAMPGFYRAKIATARFYADQMLPQAAAYAETTMAGDAALAGCGDELFE